MCDIAGWARGCGSSCWAGWSPPSPARPRYTSHARCACILIACACALRVHCRPRTASTLLPHRLHTAPTATSATATATAAAAAGGRRRALLAVHCLRRLHDLQAHLARRLHPSGHRAVPRHRKPLPPYPAHPCGVSERPLVPGRARGGGNTRRCPVGLGARGGVAWEGLRDSCRHGRLGYRAAD